jgi:hypothetical protein
LFYEVCAERRGAIIDLCGNHTQNVEGLHRASARLSQAQSYGELAKHHLAVSDPRDPRAADILRGFIVTANPDFQVLYSALFTRCKQEYDLAEHAEKLQLVLQHQFLLSASTNSSALMAVE